MGCQAEHFRIADLVNATGRCVLDAVGRRKDGTYTFRFFVDYEAETPDGRRVRINRHIGVPANECIGRRNSRKAG